MYTPNTTQRPALPLYHTIAETMATLRVSRSTVNRFVKNGALMKVSLGPGSARITTASIYALDSSSQMGS